MPEWGRLNRGTYNSYPTAPPPHLPRAENFTFLLLTAGSDARMDLDG